VADIAWCFPLAVAVALVVVSSRHLAHSVAERASTRPALGLVVAGLLVGLLAVAFRASTDRPVDLVLLSGQEQLPSVVVESSAGVLLLLVLAKGLAYALSLGAGFRGGPVFPALVLGAAFGLAAAELLPGLESTPAIATGLAAATAAVLRVPFTAVLLPTLLLGASGPEVAPIAVLAAAVGWIVTITLPTPEERLAARPDEQPGDTPADARA
jgi:H+/Cl- antiporter ClcA